MSSTNKTLKLILSQFLGTDKPTRSDYNSDMSKIDAAMRTYSIFPVGYSGVSFKSAPEAQTIFLQGQLISRTTYAALWAWAQASGNMAASDGVWTAGQFSPGDGSTTFRVPDLRHRIPVGVDTTDATVNAKGVPSALGKAGGEETHTLTAAETPPVTISASGSPVVYNGTTGSFAISSGNYVSTGSNGSPYVSNGGNGAHNIMQPWITANYFMVY